MNLYKIANGSNLKKLFFIPGLVVAMGLTGYFLLVIAYTIPTGLMVSNMAGSGEYFRKEGVYPYLMSGRDSQLDNFTDALMLLSAAHQRKNNIWKSAADVERYAAKDVAGDKKMNPADTLCHIYNDQGKDYDSITYGGYWHGYF